MRKALELEMTAQPAAAKAGSISRAMSASSAAKMTLGASFDPEGGTAGETTMLAMRSGKAVSSFHLTASPYFLPLERSLAASHATSNQGWFSRS
jgi:hypothetical protein